jgi:6,7-dimethyl-8-ribityllumazine synthase
VPEYFLGQPVAAAGDRYAIVVSRYNPAVTGRLLDGAVAALTAGGVADRQIHVAHVPGAFELPVAASQMASSGHYAAVICLGAVIRGETTHDQHINRTVSHFLGEIAVRTGRPVLFGLLTCDTLEQALQRAGGTKGNKGAECAQAALEMVHLLRQLPPGASP